MGGGDRLDHITMLQTYSTQSERQAWVNNLDQIRRRRRRRLIMFATSAIDTFTYNKMDVECLEVYGKEYGEGIFIRVNTSHTLTNPLQIRP